MNTFEELEEYAIDEMLGDDSLIILNRAKVKVKEAIDKVVGEIDGPSYAWVPIKELKEELGLEE